MLTIDRAPRLVLVAALTGAVVVLGAGIWRDWPTTVMPGVSYTGALPRLSSLELRAETNLRRDVSVLATDIGERNVAHVIALSKTADYLELRLAETGISVRRERFRAGTTTCENVVAEIQGSSQASEVVIVGAHYDSAPGSPGANDNASGVAATIEIARELAGAMPRRTLRFVLFANEEPPYFQTSSMGSLVYAQECRARHEDIAAMLSLETIGFYSSERGAQKYPFPLFLFYPSTGDFLGFVANAQSRELLFECIGSFRDRAMFPSEGGALDASIAGVGWSDHWSFWQQDYPAVEVTDTAPFRYPYYHTPLDTPDKIDFDRLARVTVGLRRVIEDLSGASASRIDSVPGR